MPPFPKIREARELLLAKAAEIMEMYILNAKIAMAAGEHEAAAKSLQWLLEHMPADQGLTIVDVSVDKAKQVEAPKGPSIQIGIALGGVPQKALPAVQVIDVLPENNE